MIAFSLCQLYYRVLNARDVIETVDNKIYATHYGHDEMYNNFKTSYTFTFTIFDDRIVWGDG